MPSAIAIAGKGGTGKTTLAALVTACLLKAGRSPILAVDADPNANLNEALGVTFDTTVVETVDDIMAHQENLPAGVPKAQFVEYQVHDALVEAHGFDLLVMGRTEGPGGYCYANDLLRGFLDKLSSSYSYVVMDNEAGMEHLSRRTTRNVNILLITATPTVTALRSAGRIYEIAQKLRLNIGKSYLVLSQLSQTTGLSADGKVFDSELSKLETSGLSLLGQVPYDDQLVVRSIEARGLLDLPEDSMALMAAKGMIEKLGL